ncbi:MAG: EamA family transporter [Gammaproteobacteria bacterium]
MTLPWYVTAIAAALIWGVHYPLVDFALKRVSVLSVLLLTTIPILLLVPLYQQTLKHDLLVWQALPWSARFPILGIMLTSLLGAVFLYVSIAGKNATLASLIEISYPVFVALFAYLLFRELHVNAPVLIGAALVFSGVALIVWHNP